MKKIVLILAFVLAAGVAPAADKSLRLSIATGGTGGVYYPLGGGMAAIISKYLSYAEATAEVTGASVDNNKLVGANKADIGFSMADVAWDAYQGLDKFKDGKLPVRALAVLYPNKMQVVTVDGKGIEKLTDLKGKHVSTGSPGSGGEVMALRLLEAYGIDPDKDLTRERLSVRESASAMKDRKLDALMWVGGLPTPELTDLAATPGITVKFLDHADALDTMRKKSGPLYVQGIIPAHTYPGQDKDVQIIDVWNILVVNAGADDKVVYDIVKALFEHKSELVAVHKEAAGLSLEYQLSGASPIPFHPGALKYFAEKGLKQN